MAETYFYREKRDRDFTVLNNTFIQDESLSWKAKGVMTYLLSLPEDWKIYLTEIETHSTDGIAGLRSAIKELMEHGYIQYERKRNEKGIFTECIYRIIENPHSDFPHVDNPHVEKPHVDNRTLLNTNNTKDLNKQNTNIIRENENRFQKPTVEEIKAYCSERNNNINPEQFYDFYESKNWYVGKNKMKDWKACVRTWERNNKSFSKNKNTTFIEQRGEHNDYDYSQDAGKLQENGDIGF